MELKLYLAVNSALKGKSLVYIHVLGENTEIEDKESEDTKLFDPNHIYNALVNSNTLMVKCITKDKDLDLSKMDEYSLTAKGFINRIEELMKERGWE